MSVPNGAQLEAFGRPKKEPEGRIGGFFSLFRSSNLASPGGVHLKVGEQCCDCDSEVWHWDTYATSSSFMPLRRECSSTQVLWSEASTARRRPILMPERSSSEQLDAIRRQADKAIRQSKCQGRVCCRRFRFPFRFRLRVGCWWLLLGQSLGWFLGDDWPSSLANDRGNLFLLFSTLFFSLFSFFSLS